MLFHLSRYLVMEVLRVFLLTTAVLTTVIAFGAAVKPLAQDDLLSAGQIMRYVFAAMVPMLQYAIPVASAFAVTLVIHRMSSDNEIVAAAVSGISYRRLLAPVAVFALALVVIMSCLTHWITPRFLRQLDRMLAHDATLLFRTALERDQAFQIGELQIYADDLVVLDHPPDSGADTRMVLQRMAAVETDSEGRSKTDITARQAVIDVFERNEQTYLKMRFADLVGYKSPSGEVFSAPELSPDRALVVPNAFRDSLDTRSTLQLHAVRGNPDSYGPVAREKEQLVEALRDHELAREIRQQLEETGELRFKADDRSEYVVRAASLRWGELFGGVAQPVEITHALDGRAMYRFECDRLGVRRSRSALLEHPSIDLTLARYQVIELASGTRNMREQLVLQDLQLTGFAPPHADHQSAFELLAQADALVSTATGAESEHQGVAQAAASLRKRLNKMSWDVSGRTAQRFALPLVVLLYTLAGMILSMLMRHAPPLMTYSIVFVPAILCLMLLFGGTEAMRDGNLIAGSIIMWSGHVIMLGMCAVGFRRLVRN